jgi:hypothetical protein
MLHAIHLRSCLLLLLGLALGGCFSVYEPGSLSAPLLAKRNDVAASAGAVMNPGGAMGYASSVLSRGGYADVAWAPTDHTRLAASAAVVDGNGSEGAYGRHRKAQLAAGWGIAPERTRNLLRVEVLGGGGYDRFDVRECQFGVDGRAEDCGFFQAVKGNSGSLFAQGHAGFVLAPVEVGGGARASVLIVAIDRLNGMASDQVIGVPILEPFAMLRGGWKWLKLEAQISAPIVLHSADGSYMPLVRNSGPRVTLGLHFSWQEFWKHSIRQSFVRDPPSQVSK